MSASRGLLLVSASLLLACVGAEGQEEGRGSGSAELSVALCEKLDEQTCLTTAGCELVYQACPACVPGGGCPPCDATPKCQASQKPPPPTDPCAGLDEAACHLNPGCFPDYTVCTAVCEDDGKGGCKPCPTTYVGCRENNLPPQPPPDTCAGLDELTCQSRKDCYPDYGACPAICEDDGKGGCKPCPEIYYGCLPAYQPPVSHCESLGERDCNAAPGCMGVYSSSCPPCPPGVVCSPCPPGNDVFSYCAPDFGVCDLPTSGGGSSGSADAGMPTYP